MGQCFPATGKEGQGGCDDPEVSGIVRRVEGVCRGEGRDDYVRDAGSGVDEADVVGVENCVEVSTGIPLKSIEKGMVPGV